MDILIFRGITLFICAVINLFFAFFLWRKREDEVAFHMGWTALFSAFYAFFCGSVYFFWDIMLQYRLFWYRTTWLGVFILPAYLIFVYYFVKRTEYIKLKAFILYLGATIIGYLAVTTPLFTKSVYLKYPYIIGPGGNLDFIGRLYILFCLGLSIFYLLREYFKSKGVRKLQIRYFVIGTSIYTIGGIISVGIIPLLLKESGYYDIPAYCSVVWISLTSYAILKYRLFDIRLVLGGLAIYIFSAITFIGIALFILFLNTQVGSLIPTSAILILILLLVIFTFSPIFRLFEKIAAKYFYYTYYNLKLTLQRLGKQLNQTIELDKLTTLINRSLLDALKLDKVGIILRDPETGIFKPQQLIKLKEEEITSLLSLKDNFLQKYLQKEKKALVREEIPFLIEEKEKRKEITEKEKEKLTSLKEEMEKRDIALFLPLFIKEELIGIIILGNKLSGEAYTVQDLDLLTTLASQAAIAFNNALSYTEIEKRKEELEKFYKLTVGRELRMIELKKKIKELEEKMEKK